VKVSGDLQEDEEYDCVLIRSGRENLHWESEERVNGYQVLVPDRYEEYIRTDMFEGAVRIIAVQEEDDIAFGEITFVPDIYVSEIDTRGPDPSSFDRTVECEIEYIDLETDQGHIIDGIRARCKKCGHETEVFKTHEDSLKRSLVHMRKECPKGEENYYESE
jgi:hypothetical protein